MLVMIALAACFASGAAYDAQVGRALGQLQQAVNCGADRFNSWAVGEQSYAVDPSKVRYYHNSVTDSVVGVGRMTDPDGCFVAVQGTTTTVQAIEDGEFWTKPFDRASCTNCWIASGWSDIYESIKDDVFNTLREFGCGARPLYITGHSLGAAVATYVLYDALDANYTVAHMIAMESPRPGDNAFAAALQAKIVGNSIDAVRITHSHDPVVHLPFAGVANYSHALEEIYYPAENADDYEACGYDDATWKCANQFSFPWLWNKADHCWSSGINPCACSIASVNTSLTGNPIGNSTLSWKLTAKEIRNLTRNLTEHLSPKFSVNATALPPRRLFLFPQPQSWV